MGLPNRNTNIVTIGATAQAALVDAVWDEAKSGHTTVGTFGGDEFLRAVKTMTYATGAGTGTAGTPVNLFTVTGRVHIISISAFCTTLLTESGATATIALGITGATSLFIAATNAVDIDANEFWFDTTPDPVGGAVPAINKDMVISADIINTIAVTNVTGGVIQYVVHFVPLSSGATLVAA